mmetsp:Transcript_12515/g.53638  ORF Transcript_12515/g.53638 Transcript_12515/m.53638 type:complete len:153 (+) Transcript_12515:50-508(+)
MMSAKPKAARVHAWSCVWTSALYAPSFLAMSCSCVPHSTSLPSLSTPTRSARRTVDRRCATRMTVLPAATFVSASDTAASLSASSALVASSSNNMAGSARTTRAIASRCFCPPESKAPFSPTRVSYPSGNASMNPRALAISAAVAMESFVVR